ncbi:MAG TPA: glucose-1-phosphate adenylyltransferase [Verrucomicrobiae bacterium]|mgnify:CR=1 FL=1|nr:glucose-1-phosphate adenylyltransferase [Verrucomicrobiae bacterium]
MAPDMLEALRSTRTVAVIMGGGAGTRLHPLTMDRAKPAVPLAGKYRLVDIPISNCLNSGLRKIYLLTQFNSSSLHRHIQRTYKFDEFSDGYVEIMAAQQTPDKTAGWYQGTADAVRRNLRHLDNEAHDLVLILSGDQLYRMDYREILAHHIARQADITVATLPVRRSEAKGFGIMQIGPDTRIVRFVEKPKEDPVLDGLRLDATMRERLGIQADEDVFLASMGIYVFNRDALKAALDNERIDFGKDIIPWSIQNRAVFGYVFEGYWEDIGTIKAFFNANLDLCAPMPKFNLFDRIRPIYTRPRYLPASKCHGGRLKDAVLADGCIIGDAALSRALLGIRSVIGSGVVMEDVVMMGADHYDDQQMRPFPEAPPLGVGDGTRVKRAIIDKNVRIGRNCVISPEGKESHADHALYCVRDGIIVIPKGAVIPDGTTL